MGTMDSNYAETVRALTGRRIDLFDKAGEDWRFAESLKSLSEDTAQEYEGRAVLELVQNGHDALADGAGGRLAVVLDLTQPPGVLYVANEGAPFTSRDFLAIIEFGLSDKGAGEGIGNKGLGFRSVLHVTDWPEVYSKAAPGSQTFDGYCFRFAAEQDLAEIIEDADLLSRAVAHISPLALPVPAQGNDPVIAELAAGGYSTVVRLPLRNDHAAAAVREQVEGLADDDAPLLLFLDRVASLTADIRLRDGMADHYELTRMTTQSGLVPDCDDWVSEVDLGRCGRYLLARRPLDPGPLKASVATSVACREVDAKWSQWEGTGAWVGIALRLDQPLQSGRLYTFLPMAETATAPLTAHAHAPFFTKLARLSMSGSVPLNDHLLRELAVLSAQLLRAVRDRAPRAAAASLVPDLACWQPHDRLDAALLGGLAREPVVPLASGGGWACLEDAFDWADRTRPWVALTRDALATLGEPVLDSPAVGEPRRERLTALRAAVIGTGMGPTAEKVAEWAEFVAAALPAPDLGGDARLWGGFYDDLHAAFAADATPLRGRSIVLDSSGTLRAALGGTTNREDTVFFSPDQSGPDAPARVPSDLRALRSRIAFTHPDIPWSKTARGYFETTQLIREYRADRVFDALRDLMAKSKSNALRRDALTFAFRQFPSLHTTGRASLSGVGFYVPRADGTWAPASQSLLSPAWDADGARRLERCLAAGGYAADEIASQRELWVADPQSWAPPVRDETLYREFLERLGVRDGLIPSALGPIVERQGSSLHPPAIAKQLGLPDLVATGWAVDVAQHWTGGNHPYTRYSFARPLTVLPGSVQAAGLQPTARREFAELVLHGLGEWDDNALAVTVWRPNRPTVQQDRHSWPTPLASALRHLPWLPVTGDDGDLEFRPPAQVWYSFEGDLPPFVPAMPRSVRELLGDARALARAEAAGLRRWGAPANAADAVRELGLALQDGAVPDYLSATFKKEYSRALASAAKEGAWPWPPGTEVVLAADRAGRLEALRPAPDELLYLPDGHDSLKQSLVELAGHPVLPADPEEGERTVSLLRAHGLRVLPLSEIDVKVFSSNQQVVPGPGRPLLVDGREWLVTVVAVVLELKGGPFRRRRTERTLRRLLAQLGAVRLARLPNVSIRVGGIDAPPPANVRSVPLPHAAHPTIAVWDAAGEWEELQSCASALSHLLSQPYLHDPLELALIKIEKMLGGASAHDLDDELLASALDTTAARVGEVRRGIEGDLDGLKRKLRPVLMCLADPADVHIAGDAVDRCASEQELEAVLADRHHDLALPAADIVALARRPSPLDEIRDALGLDFATFNNALSALGPPYAPLTHPDLHDAAFATFAAQNHEAILDRLRERYRPVAERGLAIDRYVQGRNMEGLVPDPAWLPARRVPSEAQMRARVAAWLRGHGASDDLGAPGALAPVGEMRAKANARLDSLVARAAPLVRAWCRTRPSPIPPGWDGTPLLEATFALEANGIADLVEPVDNQLLEAIAAGAGWPDGMDLTVDATDLGLTDADLAVTAGSGSSRERPVPPPATIRIGSSVLPVGTDNLARIAEVALLSVDPIFLSETGKTSLAVLASPPGPDGHGRPTGRTVVTRNRGMNEDQRSAVGIVGEVAARAWLSRKYREVRWRSGYAAIVSADPHASDSFGYDFEVDWRNTTLMFEVKAFTAEAGSLAEFEMGESEVRAAQAAARNDRYRILLVTQALDPVERRIHELPNPFSAKGQGRFRVVGRGLRYQCAPR